MTGRSMFAALASAYPDVARPVVSKAAMQNASHLLERAAGAGGRRVVLIAGFQHERHWIRARPRFDRMLVNTVAVVRPVGRSLPPPSPGGTTVIGLPRGHPLVEEWFVVGLGERVSFVLCARDLHQHDGSGSSQAGRSFEALLSTDPGFAHVALRCLLDDADLDVPPATRTVIETRIRASLHGRRGKADLQRPVETVLAAVLQEGERQALRRRSEKAARDQDLVTAHVEERLRILGDLHDGALQEVLAARQDLEEYDETRDPELLHSARDTLEAAIGRIREDLAATYELKDRSPLERRLASLLREVGRPGCPVIRIDLEPRAAGHRDDDIVVLVRELLHNAAAHARATAVSISVASTGDLARLVLRVQDDGVGVSDETLRAARAAGRIGLPLAARRVQDAGGTWTFSGVPGQGVAVEVTLPVTPATR